MRNSIACALLASLVPIGIGIAGADPAIRPGEHIAIIGNTYADQLRVHGYLETLLLQRTQGNPVSIRNLGWGADTLSTRERPTNFPTEESALLAHKTDVIITCFGMGESFAGKKGIEKFRNDLVNFITSHSGKKYNGRSEVRLILVSPIAHEDLGELTPGVNRRNRELLSYSRAMEKIASAQAIPCVNLYGPTLYLMEDDAAPRLTVNGIHLNSYGYWAASRILADALLPGEPSWLLQVDAQSGKAAARGALISAVRPRDGGIRFTVEENSPPGLMPPTSGKVHDSLAGNRDRLIVENLAPGKYLLTIDGQPVTTAGHENWAKGVTIDTSPAHRELEACRDRINDKNLQFTYSWKALNQVHIVGERKASPSGRSLPAEVIKFNELAIEREMNLKSAIKPRTREWLLLPE
ncbi:MAG: SGNH/GDSL hydrolase family protein [Verrucomicrobiales bacterium]